MILFSQVPRGLEKAPTYFNIRSSYFSEKYLDCRNTCMFRFVTQLHVHCVMAKKLYVQNALFV